VAAEDAHRQHMEALRQLEETRTAAPAFGPDPRPIVREWSLEDFLKHHLVKFDGKTSPDRRLMVEGPEAHLRCKDVPLGEQASILCVYAHVGGRALIDQHQIHPRGER